MLSDLKVGAYVRLSQEDLDKRSNYSDSICNQLDIIRTFAQRKGFQIVNEFIDDGYSGITFERPGFLSAIKAMEAGMIDVLITKDLSRLGRDFVETSYYVNEYFPSHGIRYIAITDNFDTEYSDELYYGMEVNIRSIINDSYVKDISIKRAQVAYAKTKELQFIGPKAPYGYVLEQRVGKRYLKIDKVASKIVKRIFESIAAGKTRKEVAEELNKDNILAPSVYLGLSLDTNKHCSYKWTDKIIYRILKNQTYMGSLIIRKSFKKDYKQKTRTNISICERQTVPQVFPAIVSSKLFQKANGRLRSLKKIVDIPYVSYLDKLVVCGECGKTMSVCRKQKGTGKIYYYFCCYKRKDGKKCINRLFSEEKLKHIIYTTIRQLITDFVTKEYVVTNFIKVLNKKERISLQIANIEKSIQSCKNSLNQLYMEKVKELITIENFIKQKTVWMQRLSSLEYQLKALLEQESSDTTKVWLNDGYEEFISKNIVSNDYVRELIEQIIIYQDKMIQFRFKFCIK